MLLIRTLFFSLLTALAMSAPPASATSFSTDQSDLWFVPTESGWGIQFVQRDSLIFATMFVYDTQRNPVWYVATMTPSGTSLAWTGDLLVGTGPWFGTVPFDPAMVVGRKVGTMAWTPSSVADGNLSYSVDSIAIAKHIIRQPLINENYGGNYVGGTHATTTACTVAAGNGTLDIPAMISVGQSGSTMSLNVQASDTCMYGGSLNQQGQLGALTGTYTCVSGDHGSFSMVEMQVNPSAVSGRLSTASDLSGCRSDGWFGASRKTT